jgi:predicted DsbA family dithiol-disulfide isomerase
VTIILKTKRVQYVFLNAKKIGDADTLAEIAESNFVGELY